MRACCMFSLLLATAFILSETKPQGKRHGSHKSSHITREKDSVTEEENKPLVFPTSATFEVSNLEREDEELSSESNGNSKKEDEREKSSAVLMSEQELVDLLKNEGEEEELTDEEANAGEDVRMSEEEETEGVDKELRKKEEVTDDSMEDKLEEEVEKISINTEKSDSKMADSEAKEGHGEEVESSTESEISADLDYAADGGVPQAFKDDPANINPRPIFKPVPNEKAIAAADDNQDQQEEQTPEEKDNKKSLDTPKEEDGTNLKTNIEMIKVKNTTALESVFPSPGGEEEATENKGGNISKEKAKKQKKNNRARKHSVQRDEAHPGQEESSENKVHKAKRRRAGKWGPFVGANPVQIRASADLYPDSQTIFGGALHLTESPANPCNNFRCKRGKTCKLDEDRKPGCVCQSPSECPVSLNDFDRVCGTDNKTYSTSCELFATKCNLEGTKRGQKLHLDYTGPCKLIPPCVETELLQFPLRMRDWLKNVMLQLYEQDTASSGFLTPKQRFRVKKIFENERRLHAGDHSIELLTQDFEKNYNMYIYPVHWQFAQLDQHPSDRYLSHSELAPLRVPLVPMEHCTSVFFQKCDQDKDKQVSFKEWTSCFGIRNDDMDVNLLF